MRTVQTAARGLTPVVLLPSCLASAACSPDLPVSGGHAPTSGEPNVFLEVVPSADLEAVPRVLWVRVTSTEPLDPQRLTVFQGTLGPGQMRQIAEGELSNALEERIVPARAWLDGDGALLAAPSIVLEPGETYSVALSEPLASWELAVAEKDDLPLAPRVWPPAALSAIGTLGIWCAEEPVAVSAMFPDDPLGTWAPGVASGIGAKCVRFDLRGEGAAWASPPLLPLVGGGGVRLDPRPLGRDLEDVPAPVEPADCPDGELVFGPGCADVADDRMLAGRATAPLLWAVAGEGVDVVTALGVGSRFSVWPLEPSSPLALEVATIDVAGRAEVAAFRATTRPPMAHVVIMEVLANPNGPEPAQEWIELFNDGLVGANLEGWRLADAGGETTLPEAVLGPGARALLVNESFVPGGAGDPPPHPDALLVRVPKLGKSGLSNQGEPLSLLDAGGAKRSGFPPEPKPSKAGVSISRVHPKTPDEDPAGFVKTEPPTPGSP